jgi:hypothetical protein
MSYGRSLGGISVGFAGPELAHRDDDGTKPFAFVFTPFQIFPLPASKRIIETCSREMNFGYGAFSLY